MPEGEIDLRAAQDVLRARAVLASACAALRDVGIVPAVLKGVLIAALREGSTARPRRMMDVDVLVSPAERLLGEACLRRTGWLLQGRSTTATTLRSPDWGFDLDLHDHLAEPELFPLDTETILRRSRIDDVLFGHSVRVLDPLDTYVHLVVHFVRQRGNADDRRRLADFDVVARAYELRPDDVGRALVGAGVARAARYALGLAARTGDGFAEEVLTHLPPDAVGVGIVGVAERWLSIRGGNALLAMPVPHLLAPSLARGAYSFGLHALRGLRGRVGRM